MVDFPGRSDWIWLNGNYVPWDDCRIHIASHVIHYASCVFEGIRAYHTASGAAVFRLDEHLERLYYSSKIYHYEIPFKFEELRAAVLETIRKNNLEECYIRPIVYRGYGSLGVDPSRCPVDVAIITWRWGKYLGEEALKNGVDVCVSTWQRNAANTTPSLAKCAANYMNAQLIKMEAIARGYSEGIALDVNGYIGEGSGENIFFVRRGRLLTPPLSASVLDGITRNTVMTLADELGISVSEQVIPREMLYVAEEVFFTGTAAEITPIRSVDGVPVGQGRPGEVTRQLMDRFFGLFEGRYPDRYGWLTPV